jgi:hypothetical protein
MQKNISSVLAILFFLVAVIIFSCAKEKISPAEVCGGKDNIVLGTLVINEFEARGSQFYNEVIHRGNRWFITDSLADKTKFALPHTSINPKGFLIVWCDGYNTVVKQIHSNFSLNKSGEQIGLFYKQDNGDIIVVDALNYGAQQSAVSFGRHPNGSANWDHFEDPTPGIGNRY